MRTSFKLFPPLLLFIFLFFLFVSIVSANPNQQPPADNGNADRAANPNTPQITPPNSGGNTSASDFASDIAIDRLKKFSERGSGKIDTTRPSGGFVIPPAISNIPGPAIVSDAGASSPLVGSNIKYHIVDGFSFGNGNISSAVIEWTAEAPGGRTFKKTTTLVPQGGTIANFGHAFFELKPAEAANYKIDFKIKYKILGLKADFIANAQPLTTAFLSGNAGIDNIIAIGGTNPVVIVANPGNAGDTLPGFKSKDIIVDFFRDNASLEVGLKEDHNYTWKWPRVEPQEPNCRPGPIHNYLRSAIKRGADIDSEDDTGIDSAALGQLAPKEQGNYVQGPGGAFFKKSGVQPGGSGPVPGTLKPLWTVRYPSSNQNGGAWNTQYNLDRIGSSSFPTDLQNDVFSFKPMEPTEPFLFEISMKIKHKWREFKYDKSGTQIASAISYAAQLPGVLNAQAQGDCDFRGFVTQAALASNVIAPSGGEGPHGSGISVNISNTCTYNKQFWKEVDDGFEADGTTPKKKKVEDGPPRPVTISGGSAFGCGKTKDEEKDQNTDPCIRHEMVLDTTAPKITFDSGSIGNGQGDVLCGSGDLVLIKVEISDNNLYSPLSTPYLTYETAPSGGGGGNESWSAVPLQMTPFMAVPDNNAARPYGSNSGKFQALVPVPHNIKGAKAIKWFVDAFDGSKAPHGPPEFPGAPPNGNHNKGNFWTASGGHDGNTPDTHEVPPNINGTISIYDNDRPNINVRMWKVDRAGVYLVGDFSAAEDYFVEDCYYHTNDPKLVDNTATTGTYSGFKGTIPTDPVLTAAGYQPAYPNTTLFPAAKKQKVIDTLVHQCEKSNMWFNYDAGDGVKRQNGNCPVVFEDVKYIFTVDASDNIEALVNSGARTDIPKVERAVLTFNFQDKGDNNISSTKMEFVPGQRTPKSSAGGAVHWYLGPEDPSIPVADPTMLPMEVPTFEYVFHSVSKGGDIRRMNIIAEDLVGHRRELNVNFKISEVTNELRILEEKVKRELKQNVKRPVGGG